MAAEKGEFQYVVTELSISFPAEMRIEANQRTEVRLPSPAELGATPDRDALLSRLTFSLRPVPRLQEDQTPPPKGERPPPKGERPPPKGERPPPRR